MKSKNCHKNAIYVFLLFQSAASYGWSYFLLLLLVLYSVSSLLRLWPVDAALKAGWRFAKEEVFCEEGINKKLVR